MNGPHGGVARRAFIVRGRVQGVGYRYFCCNAAAAHQIAGFVQNASDGSVQGEAEGTEAALAAFFADLRRGPRFARVDHLDTTAVPVRGEGTFTQH